MRVRTPSELGALIRDYRMRHNLDQRSLAATVGVSRQWIVEIEKGKARRSVWSCGPWERSESFSTLSRKLSQAKR